MKGTWNFRMSSWVHNERRICKRRIYQKEWNQGQVSYSKANMHKKRGLPNKFVPPKGKSE